MEHVNFQEQILNDYLVSDDRRKLYESHPEFDASTLEERLARVSDADSQNSVIIMLRELIEGGFILYNKFTITSEAFQSITIKFYNDIEVDVDAAIMSKNECKKAAYEAVKARKEEEIEQMKKDLKRAEDSLNEIKAYYRWLCIVLNVNSGVY